MDASDIVRSDTAIATKRHTLGLNMDWASDNHRMQTRKLSAVEVRNMVADMKVVQLLAMLAPEAESTDTCSNGRLCDRLLE